MQILKVDHVQLAMPPGQEDKARSFYQDVLGLEETAKPANLRDRGGVWFRNSKVQIHLGVEPDFRPARKAHPALLVDGLAELAERCRRRGVEVVDAEPLVDADRIYLYDPFGNRIELIERKPIS